MPGPFSSHRLTAHFFDWVCKANNGVVAIMVPSVIPYEHRRPLPVLFKLMELFHMFI